MKTKSLKVCNLYVRDSDILVVSTATTTAGFEISQEPIFRLRADKPNVDIGHVVLRALEAHRTNIPPPSLKECSSDRVLSEIGVRSWRQLERTSRNILVTQEGGLVSATPTQHLSGGGYTHLNELTVRCRAIPEEIGAAVRQAELLCV